MYRVSGRDNYINSLEPVLTERSSLIALLLKSELTLTRDPHVMSRDNTFALLRLKVLTQRNTRS